MASISQGTVGSSERGATGSTSTTWRIRSATRFAWKGGRPVRAPFRIRPSAVDKVQPEVEVAVALPDVVDLDDVRMLEPAGSRGFPQESQLLVLARERPREHDLERDDPVQVALAGLVDGSHAAPRDLLQDLILAACEEARAVRACTHSSALE